MATITREERKEQVKKFAKQFKKDLIKIIGKDKVKSISYSANINYESNINAVLGYNYYNQEWFTLNHDKLIELLQKYSIDSSIVTAYSELSNRGYEL